MMFAAPGLVAAQITLGIFTVLTLRSVPVAVAHFAGATALWALWMAAVMMTTSPSTVARAAAVPSRRAVAGGAA